MALGRRCVLGCESWPDEMLYKKCPVCGEETERFSNLKVLPKEEAKSILLHHLFEDYYGRWCVKRGQPVDGPLSEPEPPSAALA